MEVALQAADETTIFVLNAQSHLVAFYERFGFAINGDEFVDDGIAHTPMRRG
jgi:ElaA protein